MKKIVEILSSVIYIVEGYIKLLYDKLSGHESKRQKARMEICNNCVHNVHGKCAICGCILEAKTRVDFPLDEQGKSIDGCPKKYW